LPGKFIFQANEVRFIDYQKEIQEEAYFCGRKYASSLL